MAAVGNIIRATIAFTSALTWVRLP